jgi:ATP-dependent protease ClpP protease subunit
MMMKETASPVRKCSVAMKLAGEVTGIVRDNLLDQLKSARCREGLTYFLLLIDSPGGSTRLGGELFEALTTASQERVIHLTTYNVGRTDSAALCLFCAGSRRATGENGTFLLHQARFLRWDGDPEEMRERGERDAVEQTNLMAEIVAKSTGQPLAIIRNILRAGENRDARYAKDLGLVHEIRPYPEEEGVGIVDLTKRHG